MEKLIARWSYWLGIASFAIAILWRGLNALGFWRPLSTAPGTSLWYMSFYKGALLFFLTTVATAGYAWVDSHKP
jgi:hypothetical protein